MQDDVLFGSLQPDDFVIKGPELLWEPPCWIECQFHLEPNSPAARDATCLPLVIPLRGDLFAKCGHKQQIMANLWSLVTMKEAQLSWQNYFYSQNGAVAELVDNLQSVLKPPFNWLPRSEFTKVNLDEVLQEDPEDIEVYIASQTDSDRREIEVLRLHASLSISGRPQNMVWFEKKIPYRVRREDVIQWFVGLMKALPKRKQPRDEGLWVERLLRNEPDFAYFCSPNPVEAWPNRSKIIFIFGFQERIGNSALFHIEREDISKILRVGSEIRLARVQDKKVKLPVSYRHLTIVLP